MGQAKKNRRDCSALGRIISAAECGAGRASRIACPASCPHNPWAPANYERILDLEERFLDRMSARSGHPPLYSGLLAKRQTMQFYLETYHRQRNAAGRGFFGQWAAEGWDGLNNDLIVLGQAMAAPQFRLLELHRIEAITCEAVDLLRPDQPSLLVLDRKLAATAGRFDHLLAWTYALPHCHRISLLAKDLPEIEGWQGTDLLFEIVRHLGGPTAPTELGDWAMANLGRFWQAIDATILARRDQLFANVDAHFCTANYRLQVPLADLLQRLDQCPQTQPDALEVKDQQNGFSQARVWLATAPTPTGSIDQPTLGRLRLGPCRVSLETGTRAHYQQLRSQFEELTRGLVQFDTERIVDYGSQLTARHPPTYDRSLVAPRLLEVKGDLKLQTSCIDLSKLPAHVRTQADATAYVQMQALHRFPDQSVPLLGGATPRQAAADPQLRPQLVGLIKSMIRSHDQQNLRTGRTDPIDWLPGELGLTELLVPPPPLRPIPTQAGEPTAPEFDPIEAESPMATLPESPLGRQEVIDRFRQLGETFQTAAEIEDALEQVAPEYLELIDAISRNLPGSGDWDVLALSGTQIYFSLVPPDRSGPALDLQGLFGGFQALAMRLEQNPSVTLDQILEGCRQPVLVRLAIEGIEAVVRKNKFQNKISAACLEVLPVVLHVLANELDRLIRAETP